jgi:hypothetical protein
MLVLVTGCASQQPLLFHETFDSGDLGRWEVTDASAWSFAEDGDRKVLHLTKNSDYKAKVRSPNSIAWLTDLEMSDFVLEVTLKSLGKPNDGHRDLCLFWGRQDAEHFYYVHMGKKADPHSNSIFLVNGEPRVSIARARTEGTPWDDAYHRVVVVRDTETGMIEVYYDDKITPVMTAVDKTFTTGRIGIGSFDNTGYFDEIKLMGRRVKP